MNDTNTTTPERRDTAWAERMRRDYPEDRVGFLLHVPVWENGERRLGRVPDDAQFETVEEAEAYIDAHRDALPPGTDVGVFVEFGAYDHRRIAERAARRAAREATA